MSNRFNFTVAVLNKLLTPTEGKRASFYDTKVKGLVLLITSSGAKYFQVYRKLEGKPVRVTLGNTQV